MSLQADAIAKLCELARLEITDEEMLDVTSKLSRIVDLVDELQAADTSGVDPQAHPLERSARLRADVVTETDARDTYQRNAADVTNGLYLVPKVIE